MFEKRHQESLYMIQDQRGILDSFNLSVETMRAEFGDFKSKEFSNIIDRTVSLEKKVSSLFSRSEGNPKNSEIDDDMLNQIIERVALLEELFGNFKD